MITRYSLDFIEDPVTPTSLSVPVFWASMQQAILCHLKTDNKLDETIFRNAMELLVRRYGIPTKWEDLDR